MCGASERLHNTFPTAVEADLIVCRYCIAVIVAELKIWFNDKCGEDPRDIL
jgi:hypothetical protein